MNYHQEKVDNVTLALLYLGIHNREKGCGARAWKEFDWDTLNRLHEKGFILNPIGKARSVGMTEEGFLKAKELFEKHFSLSSADSKVHAIAAPEMTTPAKKRWNLIPEKIRKEILDNAWCTNCRSSVSMQILKGTIENRCLVLRGICKQCGGDIARLVENE